MTLRDDLRRRTYPPPAPKRTALVLAALAAVVVTGSAVRNPLPTSVAAPPAAPVAAGPAVPLVRAVPTAVPAYAAVGLGSVPVYRTPAGPVWRTLGRSRLTGGPRVFLLAQRLPARGPTRWLRVYLPVRPNGSTGWVRSADVRTVALPYRLDLDRQRHRMRLVRAGVVEATYRVGLGRSGTPTPRGRFYLTERIRLRDPAGPYGPYAFGLSGFSPTLYSFAGGDGGIGLHGTDDPASVGRSLSHGCIRMRNADITALARLLPLGTPVQISG